MVRTSSVVALTVGGVIARGRPVGCKNSCRLLGCLMMRLSWSLRAPRGRATRPGRTGVCAPSTPRGLAMTRSLRPSLRRSTSVTDVTLPSSLRTGCYDTASRQPAPGAWAPPGFLINCDSICGDEAAPKAKLAMRVDLHHDYRRPLGGRAGRASSRSVWGLGGATDSFVGIGVFYGAAGMSEPLPSSCSSARSHIRSGSAVGWRSTSVGSSLLADTSPSLRRGRRCRLTPHHG
jgi:hypothetical protein